MTPARVVVADPPWAFRDRLPGPKRGAAKHYRTLTQPEIERFLAEHSDELPPIAGDALLFLWSVAAMPVEALEVCRAWGFRPVSELVWVKTRDGPKTRDGLGGGLAFGMGRYVRNAHESCIIATRGRGVTVIRSHSIRSVVFAPRGRHSAKPDAFYSMVEELTVGPRLELFARTRRAGWIQHGLELEGP